MLELIKLLPPLLGSGTQIWHWCSMQLLTLHCRLRAVTVVVWTSGPLWSLTQVRAGFTQRQYLSIGGTKKCCILVNVAYQTLDLVQAFHVDFPTQLCHCSPPILLQWLSWIHPGAVSPARGRKVVRSIKHQQKGQNKVAAAVPCCSSSGRTPRLRSCPIWIIPLSSSQLWLEAQGSLIMDDFCFFGSQQWRCSRDQRHGWFIPHSLRRLLALPVTSPSASPITCLIVNSPELLPHLSLPVVSSLIITPCLIAHLQCWPHCLMTLQSSFYSLFHPSLTSRLPLSLVFLWWRPSE